MKTTFGLVTGLGEGDGDGDGDGEAWVAVPAARPPEVPDAALDAVETMAPVASRAEAMTSANRRRPLQARSAMLGVRGAIREACHCHMNGRRRRTDARPTRGESLQLRRERIEG
jgi:hypothetical protein